MNGAGAIIGRVATSSGKPVADAGVLIVGSSPAHHDLAARTNSAGEYLFRGVRPGVYEIKVSAYGFAQQVRSTQVEPGATARLNFTLE